MSREVKIITTDDGSNSLFVPSLNESYHSFHGAYRESIHVFLLYGLEYWASQNRNKKPVRIFEVGFGTGLNAWLTLIWAEQNQVPVLYHTIEPFPIEKEIYEQLNYTRMDENLSHFHPHFGQLHDAPWDQGGVISQYFNMKKDRTTLEEVQLYDADIVFFDAFAPRKQPELWTKEILAKVVEVMNPGAVLVTYCAKAQVRRDLKDLGMEVQIHPGPPGKKEMTRAIKLALK